MDNGTGLAEALLGLEGFRVLAVSETADELVIRIETASEQTGCNGCGTRAVAHERMSVDIRDLACFGRPPRLVWSKRRWRCSTAFGCAFWTRELRSSRKVDTDIDLDRSLVKIDAGHLPGGAQTQGGTKQLGLIIVELPRWYSDTETLRSHPHEMRVTHSIQRGAK